MSRQAKSRKTELGPAFPVNMYASRVHGWNDTRDGADSMIR
jgi:hypothetical protein